MTQGEWLTRDFYLNHIKSWSRGGVRGGVRGGTIEEWFCKVLVVNGYSSAKCLENVVMVVIAKTNSRSRTCKEGSRVKGQGSSNSYGSFHLFHLRPANKFSVSVH